MDVKTQAPALGSLQALDAEEAKIGESKHVEMLHGLTSEDDAFLSSFTEADKKKLLRKIDVRLIPLLAFLYLISYLDRANIGNAKIEGLLEDLDLSGQEYNIALSLFFIPYILLEIPSNMILCRFKKPSTYIGLLVVSWGIVMTLHGIVKDYAGLVVARFVLGICEAGFFPGAVYLVSQWYLPDETQMRIALFYTSSALSGAFAGLLAFAIAKMDGIGGLEGWRWIFILEGLLTVVTGVATFFLLVDSPGLSSRWLADEEIRYLELRQAVRQGNSARDSSIGASQKWKTTRSVLLDWQLYLLVLVYWSNSAPNYGMKFTMPQIIKNMGYTSSNAQLMTIPPYMIGAISAWVSAFFADRLKWRMPFILGAQVIIVIAFVILYTKVDDIENNVGVCYFAVILACVGFYPITPGTNTWAVNNLAGPMKRAQGVAFVAGFGNIGGIIGSNIYLEREKPKYPTGFGVSFGMACLGIVSCLELEMLYYFINTRRAQLTDEEVRAKYSDEDLAGMGDRSPMFRYTL